MSIHLLEPSNLLEPLDLTDEHLSKVHSARNSDRGGPPSVPRRSARQAMPRTVGHGRRSPFKSTLIVGGAVVCLATGTLLARTIPLGVLKPAQSVENAARVSTPPASTAALSNHDPAQTTSNEPAPGSSPPPAAEKGGEVQGGATLRRRTSKGWTDPVPAGNKAAPESLRDASALTSAPPAPIGIQPGTAVQPQATQPAPPVANAPDSQRTGARGSEPKQEFPRNSRRSAHRGKASQQFSSDDEGATARTSRSARRSRPAPDETIGRAADRAGDEDGRMTSRALRENERGGDGVFWTDRTRDRASFETWRPEERMDESAFGRVPREGRVVRQRKHRDEWRTGVPARERRPVMSIHLHLAETIGSAAGDGGEPVPFQPTPWPSAPWLPLQPSSRTPISEKLERAKRTPGVPGRRTRRAPGSASR